MTSRCACWEICHTEQRFSGQLLWKMICQYTWVSTYMFEFALIITMIYEPVREKPNNLGFRQGMT